MSNCGSRGAIHTALALHGRHSEVSRTFLRDVSWVKRGVGSPRPHVFCHPGKTHNYRSRGDTTWRAQYSEVPRPSTPSDTRPVFRTRFSQSVQFRRGPPALTPPPNKVPNNPTCMDPYWYSHSHTARAHTHKRYISSPHVSFNTRCVTPLYLYTYNVRHSLPPPSHG